MQIDKIFYLIIIFQLTTIQISLIYLFKIKGLVFNKINLFEELQSQHLKKYYRRIELLEEYIQPILNELEVALNEIKGK